MARRRHGEGSIYRRKDGRWVAVVSLNSADGRRQRKSFYSKTRGEAQERLTQALHNAHETGLVPQRSTLGYYLDEWLEQTVKPAVRPNTYAFDEQMVRLHIKPQLGHLPLAHLTPQHAQGLLNSKLPAGFAPPDGASYLSGAPL